MYLKKRGIVLFQICFCCISIQTDMLIIFLILFVEAYNVLLEAQKKNIMLDSVGYSAFIKVLLSEGYLEKALKVKNM